MPSLKRLLAPSERRSLAGLGLAPRSPDILAAPGMPDTSSDDFVSEHGFTPACEGES